MACWEACTLSSCPEEGFYLNTIVTSVSTTCESKSKLSFVKWEQLKSSQSITHRNKSEHLGVFSLEVLTQVVLELSLDLRPILEESSV